MAQLSPLSPDIAALVEQHIDGKQFHSADDVMKAALGLLQGYQDRYRKRLHADIKVAAEQVERGEVVTVDADGLEEMFADIERQGLAQFQAGS
jgi:Arc/MetJ-type ribon-helix-helix transcriptional regulator